MDDLPWQDFKKTNKQFLKAFKWFKIVVRNENDGSFVISESRLAEPGAVVFPMVLFDWDVGRKKVDAKWFKKIIVNGDRWMALIGSSKERLWIDDTPNFELSILDKLLVDVAIRKQLSKL